MQDGDTYTDRDGIEHTIRVEKNDRLPCVRICEEPASRSVYGVFFDVDRDDDVGDIYASALGIGFVRIAAGVTVGCGDLIECSEVPGCGRVQADDLVRSSTVGKVVSTVSARTYEDGSYAVPCAIYCG
jgi:hypothetical protein